MEWNNSKEHSETDSKGGGGVLARHFRSKFSGSALQLIVDFKWDPLVASTYEYTEQSQAIEIKASKVVQEEERLRLTWFKCEKAEREKKDS